MKLKHLLPLVGLALVLIMNPSAEAQKSKTAAKANQDTVSTLKTLEERGNTLRKRLSLAVENLEAIQIQASRDPVTPYKKFQSELQELEELRVKARQDVFFLRANTDATYKAWESELFALPDGTLKDISATRLAAAKDRFAVINKDIQVGGEKLTQVATQLQDINQYFKTELNKTSIEAVAPIIAQIKTQSAEADAAIAKVQADFTELRKDTAAK